MLKIDKINKLVLTILLLISTLLFCYLNIDINLPIFEIVFNICLALIVSIITLVITVILFKYIYKKIKSKYENNDISELESNCIINTTLIFYIINILLASILTIALKDVLLYGIIITIFSVVTFVYLSNIWLKQLNVNNKVMISYITICSIINLILSSLGFII